jgi:hypothetical protein
MKITAHFHGPGSSENPTMFGFAWKITAGEEKAQVVLYSGIENTKAEMYRIAAKHLRSLQQETRSLASQVEAKAKDAAQ